MLKHTTDFLIASYNKRLTVPAVDLEDKNVLCFKRDNPKSPTCTIYSLE